MQIFNIIDIS